MKLNPCSKHEAKSILEIQETIKKSGDHTFRVKCPRCGKLGPERVTFYGAQIAWNKLKEETNHDN